MIAQTISTRSTRLKFLVVILATVLAFGATIFYGTFGAVLAGVVFLIWFFSSRLTIGWYILVALSPFIGWQIYLEHYFRGSPFFAGWNAPPVEFWAILMLLAFALDYVRQLFDGAQPRLIFPRAKYFLLFGASAFLSLINIPASERLAGVKFIAHFFLFTYFAYVFLGANIVKSKIVWENSLKILVGVGIFGAATGAWSLFIGAWNVGGLERAVPLPIGGIWPLGDQHILLAEFLLIALISAWYFYLTRKTFLTGLLTLFIGVVGLLTWSRSFWLAIIITGAVVGFQYRAKINWAGIAQKFLPLLIILLFVVGYWFYFMYSADMVIGSSNSARASGAEFAWELARTYPLIGAGVGSFVPRLSEIYYYRIDFGDAVDALGWPQKILAEQGFLGFGIFVGLIASVLYSLRSAFLATGSRANRIIYFSAFCLFLAPLIFEMFTTNYYSARLWVPLALALAVIDDL
ncbi:MAG: hypothetical protein A3J93_02070 [Candidatus Magasanikbacteria bacterium RIFOXYC2_FULL_42_28]|uniref:O-antigen polymerase n=1 Tax=Candidatus Magasanikbacteria bacterium RIFOXYC2_FULL_42_28 TaxID=1798704 RepID=A0A1F6NXA6_9BACT|nr:MAG: hypothetical protein A3J93_02070 [Candidatus Magasanikbacteria bacterium RIFOXYC2_FULL_42_28]